MKYTEAILSNGTRKLLWFAIIAIKMMIAVLENNWIVLFTVIFAALSLLCFVRMRRRWRQTVLPQSVTHTV